MMIKRIGLAILILCMATILAGPASTEIAAADNSNDVFSSLEPIAAAERLYDLRRGQRGYDGVADSSLVSGDARWGAESILRAGTDAEHGGILLRFDLSGIPSEAIIEDAWLELYVDARSDAPATASLYRVLRAWDETSADWHSPRPGDIWAVAGAAGAASDYDPAPFAMLDITQAGNYQRVSIAGMAQHWVRWRSLNHGLLLRSDADVRIRSSEDANTLRRPRLLVAWHMPEDGAGGEALPQVLNEVTSFGPTEAFGSGKPGTCIQIGPDTTGPSEMTVLLSFQGVPASASLSFAFSNNNSPNHHVLVNGQPIGMLPGMDYRPICSGGTPATLPITPSLLLQGLNMISITNEVVWERSWGLQDPKIRVQGDVQGPDIRIVQVPSSLGFAAQPAIVQKPIGYAPDTPTPLVIALHHWGGRHYDGLTWLSLAASERGWLLASPDTGVYADGSKDYTASLRVQREVLDLLNYLIDSPDYMVDESRVYLVGTSMGGMLASTIAAKYPDRFAGLVSLKGPSRLDTWYYQSEPWRQSAISSNVGGATPTQNPFEYHRRSAEPMHMNLRNVPTALIHAENDAIVPYSHSRTLYDAMVANGSESVILEPFTADPNNQRGHGDDHPAWNAQSVLSYLSRFVRNTRPLTVTIRTDEPKSYYWLGVQYVNAGTPQHWTRVNASLDPKNSSIQMFVWDERTTPTPVNVILNLRDMGLPTHVSYAVEELNSTTGEFRTFLLQAGDSLVVNVPRDARRFLIYPSDTAPVVYTKTLRQGHEGYTGVVDTYIYSWDDRPQDRYTEPKMVVRSGGGYVPLLRFDLTSALEGMTVQGARLKLFTGDKWSSTANIETSAHALLLPWEQAYVSWYKRLEDSAETWQQAGAREANGDYEERATDTQWFYNANTWYIYNLTDLVLRWIAAPDSNHGILLRGLRGENAITIHSSENSVNRPELEIYYTEPTATPTFTLTPTPTNTPTPTSTVTPMPTSTPTNTPTPTPTPTSSGRIYLPFISRR